MKTLKFSDEEMYKTYSEYYKTEITPDTLLKVIKFKLIKIQPND